MQRQAAQWMRSLTLLHPSVSHARRCKSERLLEHEARVPTFSMLLIMMSFTSLSWPWTLQPTN